MEKDGLRRGNLKSERGRRERLDSVKKRKVRGVGWLTKRRGNQLFC